MTQISQKVAPIGELRDKEILKNSSSYIYATHGDINLLAHISFPNGDIVSGRPVVLFFHGGFWETSTVTQFVPHSHHFASRGAVAISFEYRVQAKHQTGPLEAIEDAKLALTWLHENADLLGIDLQKAAFAGAAGGAYLALVLTMLKKKAYAAPFQAKALILYSSLLNTTRKGQLYDRFPDKKIAKAFSPSTLMRRKLPPMLLMHGKADKVTPFAEAVSFTRRMKWRGNRCQLLDFNAAEHSFFNFNVSHSYFEAHISAADSFLVEQGVLKEEVNEFDQFNIKNDPQDIK